VQTEGTYYNCFMYAKTFITGAFPSMSENDRNALSPDWLNAHGFSELKRSTTLNGLPPAKLGDLVIVEDANSSVGRSPGSLGWSHVGIVIGVDLNNRITRIRQKIGPNANDCVEDTTAAQFQAIEPLQGSEQYELWRDNSVGFLGKLAR
jgi:CHAP domain